MLQEQLIKHIRLSKKVQRKVALNCFLQIPLPRLDFAGQLETASLLRHAEEELALCTKKHHLHTSYLKRAAFQVSANLGRCFAEAVLGARFDVGSFAVAVFVFSLVVTFNG